MRAAKNGDSARDETARPRRGPSRKNGTTALMLAAGLGRGLGVFANDYATEAQLMEAVEVLLERDADVNAVNNDGQTALHFAAQASDEIVELLGRTEPNWM